MAAANFLALLDDIATILDDVSTMTKVAAKKTSGLVGDDLAVNADNVTGFPAKRELPVIWGVTKGALLNKLALIPLALLLSSFAPWLLAPLLLAGGTYLSYEGAHKIYHKLFHKEEDEKHKDDLKEAFRNDEIDMVEYEQKKIRGAIWTDAILSAEILVIALSTFKDQPVAAQFGALLAIGYGMVAVVYGLVAGIVKIDDIGLRLRERDGVLSSIGDGLVWISPKIMRALGVIGTVAMLLVGGGIYAHNIKPIEHAIHDLLHGTGFVEPVLTQVANGTVGLVVGFAAIPLVAGFVSVTGFGGDEH